jgi:SAM-dependent methyltransferase
VILESGAYLYAVDLSEAVEANYENCKQYQRYHVCQADILKLPFPTGQFDIVICIGVVQHTPDPEKTMSSLCSQVRPGGMLVLDHYSYDYSLTFSRRALRAILVRLPTGFSYRISKGVTTSLWLFHRLLWKIRHLPFLGKVRSAFLQMSPVVDYHDSYIALGPKLLKEWAILDTHDTLTDVYKHLRSAEDIAGHLQRCGMVGIQTAYAGNGVEARAWKPSVSTGTGEEVFSGERS